MSYPPPPPVPIAPLAYDSYQRNWRPGIITAMGVMSIVVACFSGLVSLYSSLASFGFMMMSQITTPLPQVATPAPAPGTAAVVTVGGIQMDGDDIADGLAEQPRRNVMKVLEATVPLNAPRVRQLDALLKFGGRDIFPSAADGATLENIRANITEKGRMPGSSGAPGPQFFVVGTGKIEVYDDHAVFRPDGSADVISISAPTVAPTTSQSGTTIIHDSYAVVQPPAGPAVPIRAPVFKISPIATGASILASLASLGLAIYLFVIGIMVLRDSRSGAKLHWYYVFLKIPQVILASVAGWWVAKGLSSSFTALTSGVAPPTPSFGNFMAIWAIIFAGVALAYPIALIFVLKSRTVREYYGSIRAA